MIYNVLARSTTHYRALIGDASAQVMKLVSRDLDRAKFPLPQAAFNDKGPSAAHHSGRILVFKTNGYGPLIELGIWSLSADSHFGP